MTVLVTGIGYLTGAPYTLEEILSGASSPTAPGSAIGGLQVHQMDNKRASTGVPRSLLRKMDQISKMTTTAVGMALMDGGLLNQSPTQGQLVFDSDETGLMLDTGFGSAGAVSQILGGIFSEEPEISPLRFPNVVANAASGQAAIAFGLRGPSSTLGGVGSLMYAYDMLNAGRAKRLVVGGADEVTPIYAQALTDAGADEVIPAFGDGAAFLVLEDEYTATRRGATASAEVVAVDVSSDLRFRLEGASAFSGEGLDRAVASVLTEATGGVDWLIGSGWPGTLLREREEAIVRRHGIITALWPKDFTGEMFAASNALHTLLATVVLQDAKRNGAGQTSVLVTGHDSTRGQSSAALFRSITDQNVDALQGAKP
ncbi:3-oxoacyl-(acyl-carrier-protein) synthase [Arthrobacter sp. 2762]